MMPGMQYEQRVQAPQLPSRYPERNALSPKNSTRSGGAAHHDHADGEHGRIPTPARYPLLTRSLRRALRSGDQWLWIKEHSTLHRLEQQRRGFAHHLANDFRERLAWHGELFGQ